ncbi:HD domain-containing protein [Mycobacterium intracellulare]|uniref:HD domain-containing protein n=1 Tax=Mycobacterium intracellulare TaxID=1767 RepID=UPI001E3986F4|nr:HD domain-containing protein [Mycobacterium intracellulare]
MNVEDAQFMALKLLSKSTYASAAPVTTPRYSHSAGVAATAGRLARVLAPGHEEDIVAAAWLHDIGYSPELMDTGTGFHPLDGAKYAEQAGISPNVVSLIAHHTGAVVEARERGLDKQLAAFPLPVNVAALAILSCADLCTGPDGVPVDPAERIDEVLQRYPATDPVHRAIATSAPLLIGQARLVLAAAEAAGYEPPRVDLPGRVDCVPAGPQWCAVWSDVHYRVTARRGAQEGTGKTFQVANGVGISLASPPEVWDRREAESLSADLAAASAAASGDALFWQEYRADPAEFWFRVDDEEPTSTFDFDDVVELLLDMAARARPVRIQRRTFKTLSDVTEWTDIAHLTNDRPGRSAQCEVHCSAHCGSRKRQRCMRLHLLCAAVCAAADPATGLACGNVASVQ